MPSNDSTKIHLGIIYYLLAAMFLLYEMSVQSSPSVMAVPMMQSLQLNSVIFGSAMGAYFYSYALMQIPAGLLFDRFSSKSLLIFATLICAIGSLLFSHGSAATSLALARFLTGLGSAFAFIGVLVIADQWFDAKYFPLLVGIAQLLAAVGAMSGEMPLAYWVNHFGWAKTSLILAAIGAVLMLAILLIMQSAKPKQSQQAITLKQSLTHIFKNPQTFWIALYAFSAWAPITLFAELWGVPYLMRRYHVSNVDAALAVSMIWIALAISSPWLGWYSERIQRRRELLDLCAIVGLISAVILLFYNKLSFSWVFVILLGIGFAAAGQILTFALVKDNNQEHDLATGIGFNNMAVVIGGAIFQPAVGYLLHHHASIYAHQQTVKYTAMDYRFALSVMILCYIIGWTSSHFLIKDKLNVSN